MYSKIRMLEFLGTVVAISGRPLSFPRLNERNICTKQTLAWISRDRIDRRPHTLGATLPADVDSTLFVSKYTLALSLMPISIILQRLNPASKTWQE